MQDNKQGITTATNFIFEEQNDEFGRFPAVSLAAFAVKSLSLDAIRWLVMAVIVYTAVTMFRSALAEQQRQDL